MTRDLTSFLDFWRVPPKMLLAFNAGDESRASEYRTALKESEFAARFVPGTEVEQWLNSSATP
jgi:hypothetical protein